MRLIVVNINKDFISSFVEKTVSRWLNQIQEAYQSHVDEGENDILALVYTLSQSYFSDNVSLYFKLSNRKFEEKDVKRSLLQHTGLKKNHLVLQNVIKKKQQAKKQKSEKK